MQNEAAVAKFFDALEALATSPGRDTLRFGFARDPGWVDMDADVVVEALLQAGWVPTGVALSTQGPGQLDPSSSCPGRCSSCAAAVRSRSTAAKRDNRD